jgi:hypothetical protein
MKKLILAALLLTFSGLTFAQSIYDQCVGILKYYGSDKIGMVQTQIVKDTIILKITDSRNQTKHAKFKIISSSNISSGGDIHIWGKLISSSLNLDQDVGFIQFTANDSVYYGDPEGSFSLKTLRAGEFGNGFAGSVLMRCTDTQTSGQILKMEQD